MTPQKTHETAVEHRIWQSRHVMQQNQRVCAEKELLHRLCLHSSQGTVGLHTVNLELKSLTQECQFLSRISMQCMQSAILFYQFSPCVHSMLVLCLNKWTYRHIFWRSSTGIILVFPALPLLQMAVALNVRGWEIFANITIYLENGMR